METLTTLFESFLRTPGARIDPAGFVLHLALAGVLAFVLSRVYSAYGHAWSNRRALAGTFVLVAMATVLVITVVQTSLALALGVVAALSILRLRAAVREPEELAYLFLAVAIGLGLGAGQRVITVVAFALVVLVAWLRRPAASQDQRLRLTVSSHNPKKAALKDVFHVLERHCSTVELERLDDSRQLMEASFVVHVVGQSALEAASTELQQLGDDVTVNFSNRPGPRSGAST
jgi:hypothetical protein